MTNERLYLLDGSALAYRAHFAMSRAGLTNSEGMSTGAVYGFTNTLIKLMDEEDPHYLVVVWDHKGPTVRHEQYPEYKATREKMPEELVEQLESIEQVVHAFRIPFLQKKGYEADDIIGTLAQKAAADGIETYIVSGDKDFMQLINDKILMYRLNRKNVREIVGPAEVKEKVGVPPEQIRDYLALLGDTSDNVPGVPGVGKKTAKNLLQKWSDIETMLENVDKLGSKRVVKGFEENREQLLLSQKLVTIHTDLELDVDYHDMKLEDPDREKLFELFKFLGFRRLTKKFSPGEEGTGQTPAEAKAKGQLAFKKDSHHILQSEDDVTKYLEKVAKSDHFAVHLSYLEQPGGPNKWEGLTITTDGEEATSIAASLFDDHRKKPYLALSDLLSGDSEKIGFDLKTDLTSLRRHDLDLAGPYRDVMLEAYLLDPTGTASVPTLDKLGWDEFAFQLEKRKKSVQTTMWDTEGWEKAGGDAVRLTYHLHKKYRPQIEGSELKRLSDEVEMPLLRILADMEGRGIALDVKVLKKLSQELQKKIDKLTEEIYEIAGEEFNINSTKQLRKILYEKLKVHEKVGVKKIKKTKTGYSTDHSMLEKLSDHPLPKALLEYRTYTKLVSTYIDPLPQLVNPDTGRIHTTYQQAVTATGRLSSINPNLQNIPIRTPEGSRIREAFVPSAKDRILLAADYSQIELRILAHFSGDETLQEAFSKGEDIHTKTASKIMDLDPKDVTPRLRSQAKAVNFGIIYGMGPRRLSEEQKISLKEAKQFIENYFTTYPKIKEYLDKRIEYACEHKQAETILGRIRLLAAIDSSNHRLKAEAERMAINTPIQGSSADIIKLAMVEVATEMEKKKWHGEMLLQVHDELVFDIPKKEADKFGETVKKIMEGVIKLDVPLKVDVGTGKNWLEAH